MSGWADVVNPRWIKIIIIIIISVGSWILTLRLLHTLRIAYSYVNWVGIYFCKHGKLSLRFKPTHVSDQYGLKLQDF